MATNFLSAKSMRAARPSGWCDVCSGGGGHRGGGVGRGGVAVLSAGENPGPQGLGAADRMPLRRRWRRLGADRLAAAVQSGRSSGWRDECGRSGGGKRIHTNTSDPVEKRVLNVVEEMALASGVPVPPVYLLPENKASTPLPPATRPATRWWRSPAARPSSSTRDELQGVIAHEFSHILNGDMRLNIRLIGVLHGILLLGLLGRILFRSRRVQRSRQISKNNRGDASVSDRPGVW